MFLTTILIIGFTIVAAALILIILVQRPQGGGLAGAFGGAGGGSDTVFGGRTGDALTIATVIAFVLFLGLSIALNLIDPRGGAAQAGSTDNAAASTDGTDLSNTGNLPGTINTGATGLTGGTPPANVPPLQPVDANIKVRTQPDSSQGSPLPGTTDPAGAQPE